MNPVIINTRSEGYDYHSFYKRFLEICKEHRSENRALVFAFILYDFRNAQIAKVLNDTEYWLSLNETAGKSITVFSLHYKPKVRFSRKSRDFGANPNIMHHLTSVSHFDNPSVSSNSLIEKYFGQNVQVKYPAVFFFQIHDDKVLDYTLIQLEERDIHQAFLEIQTYIENAVEALKQVTEENRQNSQEIFDLVDRQVQSVRAKRVAKKVVKTATSVVELAATVAGLGS